MQHFQVIQKNDKSKTTAPAKRPRKGLLIILLQLRLKNLGFFGVYGRSIDRSRQNLTFRSRTNDAFQFGYRFAFNN